MARVESSASPAASEPSASPANSAQGEAHAPIATTGGPCPAGMALVSGTFCPAVAHFCAEWVRDDPTAALTGRPVQRCRRFKEQLVCEGDEVRLHVCMDLLEYPNLPGVAPAVMATYRDAERACAAEGKRVCESDEWILACEGPRMRPYPMGLERDPKSCNLDRPRRLVNPEALARPADVSLEVARLDQRTRAGTNPKCVSHFGVQDLVGNVAEWVHDRKGQRGGETSDTALAGGGWEPAPSTCRALDSRHGPDFASHLGGFRCCADALDGEPARRKGLGSGRRRAVR
ncbi:MAG: SUMF1/EgtB/PvdO family nonheme iron enzyme [Deltaproteobacteria bacterium]|nr:SUMF1/EgtB/PvdO family nonheme iron enzyme [Deltaproteobacteria bacterium]